MFCLTFSFFDNVIGQHNFRVTFAVSNVYYLKWVLVIFHFVDCRLELRQVRERLLAGWPRLHEAAITLDRRR